MSTCWTLLNTRKNVSHHIETCWAMLKYANTTICYIYIYIRIYIYIYISTDMEICAHISIPKYVQILKSQWLFTIDSSTMEVLSRIHGDLRRWTSAACGASSKRLRSAWCYSSWKIRGAGAPVRPVVGIIWYLEYGMMGWSSCIIGKLVDIVWCAKDVSYLSLPFGSTWVGRIHVYIYIYIYVYIYIYI